MKMGVINKLVAIVLVVATALLGQFYLGSKEDHDQLMAQHFWQELNLRFIFCSGVGLMGAGLWWGLNYGLLKIGLVLNSNLRKTTLSVVVGVMIGSLVGTLIFCLS